MARALLTYLVLLFLCSILVAQQAKQPTPAKPTKEQIAHWLEQLGDNDFDKREEASRKLWEAGELAEVAVREAVKSTDPEVKRRARELLDKFKWGIYPTTPKAIVELIGRYHGQDKVEAVRGLLEAGPAGCKSLLKILAAEDTPEAKKVLQDVIVAELPRSVPQLLARNDFTTLETLLNTGMAGDNPAGLRHAAAYWLLRGQLDQKIKHYRALEARGDKATAKANAEILACLYRARGDFVAARGAARRAGREDLVDAMLYEAGDWNEDAWARDDAQIVRPTARRPGSIPPKYEKLGFRTACKRLTGTPQEFEAAVGEVLKLADNLKPDDETDRFSLAAVLLFNHRPKEALTILGKSDAHSVEIGEILLKQGRYAEVLAAVDNAREKNRLIKDAMEKAVAETRLLRLELLQARVYAKLGEKEKAKALFAPCQGNRKRHPDQSPCTRDSPGD